MSASVLHRCGAGPRMRAKNRVSSDPPPPRSVLKSEARYGSHDAVVVGGFDNMEIPCRGPVFSVQYYNILSRGVVAVLHRV